MANLNEFISEDVFAEGQQIDGATLSENSSSPSAGRHYVKLWSAKLLLYAVIFSAPCTSSCGYSRSRPVRQTQEGPKFSGKPLMSYDIREGEGRRTGWLWVITKRRPSDGQLIDIALDIRAKHPGTHFEVIDSAANITTIQADYNGDLVPRDFMREHDFGMYDNFIDPDGNGMQWILVTIDDRIIAKFPNTPADEIRIREMLKQGVARVQNDEAEARECLKLQDKALADVSTSDLQRLRDCKADGFGN